jgi:hypothetical protein
LFGPLFLFGSTPINWRAARQSVVALSTQEAEYIALTSAVRDCLWVKQLLEEIGTKQQTVKTGEDNEACIALAENPQARKSPDIFKQSTIGLETRLKMEKLL